MFLAIVSVSPCEVSHLRRCVCKKSIEKYLLSAENERNETNGPTDRRSMTRSTGVRVGGECMIVVAGIYSIWGDHAKVPLFYWIDVTLGG
jgi:hypothetical protein